MAKVTEKKLNLNNPIIISNIFQYLPAFDLCRFACVNKLWNEISAAELRQRKKPAYFYQSFLEDDKCKSQRSMENAGTFEEELDAQIRSLEVKPAFCIAFATCTLWENFEKFFPSHPIFEPKKIKLDKNSGTLRQKHLESIVNTALKKRLPPKCQVCVYVGIYIAGTLRKSGKHVTEDDPAISGYVFPEFPQPTIQFCRMSHYNCDEFRTTATQKNLKSALVLMNYKTIEYYTMKLKEIYRNLSRSSILFPVQMGSDVIPLFFGPMVDTVCFQIPYYKIRYISVIQFDDRKEEDEETKERRTKVAEENELQKKLYEHRKFKLFQKLEKSEILTSGTIAFVFGKRWFGFAEFCEEFSQKYPFIPFAGLSGMSHKHKEPEEDSASKCLLVSFNN